MTSATEPTPHTTTTQHTATQHTSTQHTSTTQHTSARGTPAEGAAAAIIAELGMIAIPGEGAWFAPGPRIERMNTITALLADTADGFSALHRLDVDEGWTWLDGAPIRMFRLLPDGTGVHDVLDAGNRSVLVERGQWQGASSEGEWSLFTCWCAPAFREDGFELAERDELIGAHPMFTAEITALTRVET